MTAQTRQGTIKYWHDEKGYGFILPAAGGKEVFFHISSWQGSGRPVKGQAVSFSARTDNDGRINATRVIARNAPQAGQQRRNRMKDKPRRGWFVPLLAPLLTLFILFAGGTALEKNTGFFSSNPLFALLTDRTGEREIERTIALIKHNGPFPYPDRDGTVFANRERLLPAKPYGYYHEYTVPTPGLSHRGARRIVTGGTPPKIYYYTDNHYRSFKKLDVKP